MPMGKALPLGLCLLILFTISPADAISIENLEKLNITDTDLSDPVLSPDGSSIAYVTYDNARNQQIFIINADGTGKRVLTNTTLKKWGVSWGKDRIAYVSFGKDGLEKIFVINPDGTDNRQLILDNTRQGNSAEDKPPTWAAPSWSHDGRFLLYTSLDAMMNPKMYMVNADGTGKRPVFTDNFKQWSPSISPDGKNIVYVSYNARFREELFIVDISGTARRQLTFDEIKKNNPVWGPDGTITYVSFESIGSSGEKIFAINQDGTDKRLLVDSDFKQRNPSFSIDGRKFAYAAIITSGPVKIAVGDVTGVTVAVTPLPTEIPTTPAMTTSAAPTQAQTPTIVETPSGSPLKGIVITMLLALAVIVIVMVALLVISDILHKK